jgi:CubicO group peptidase (beta-lactamase class C family)
VGEVVRRISGKSLGQFFADEVAGPLGLEFWIGLPDEQQRRVSDLIPMDAPEGLPMMMSEEGTGTDAAPGGLIAMLDMFLGEGNLAARALTAPGGAFTEELIWNEDRVRAAEVPAANGVTNANSLARMYAGCVGEVQGTRILSEATMERAIELQSEGPDSVLIFPIPFAFGFMRHSQMSPFAGDRSFGHYGAGGSVGFADPDRRLAVGYVMNKMHFGLAGDPRTAALIEVVDRLVD